MPFVTQLLMVLTIIAALGAAFLLALRLFSATVVSFGAAVLITPTTSSLKLAVQRVHEASSRLYDFLGQAEFFPLFLLMATLLMYGRIRMRQVNKPNSSKVVERTAAVLALGGAILYVLTASVTAVYPLPTEVANLPTSLGRMWLPAEVVTFRDGSTRIGYVLSTKDDWTSVLKENPRTIELIRSDEVTARAICRTDSDPQGVPLISRVPSLPTLMSCPLPRPAASP